MASLQRVSRYWRALFTGPDGKRICRTLKTESRAVAAKMAADLEHAARQARAGLLTTERGRAVVNEILSAAGQTPLDVTTTKDFCNGWLRDKQNTKAANTATRYKHVIRDFLDCLGPVAEQPLSAVLPRHVEAFRDKLTGAGRAPSSLRLDLKIVAGVFKKAIRQGLLASNPCGAVELDQSTGQTREPFSPSEVEALLRSADGDWKTAVHLGAFAGLRLGDAVNLTWPAVDFAEGVLRFTPQKTARKGRTVTVPLHPRLASHLESIAGDDAGAICPTLAGRPSGGNTGLSRAFIGIMEAAGIGREASKAAKGQARAVSGKSFHSLRHFFNSALLAAGVDEKTRMDLSGHSTAAMNRKYSHTQLETLKAAVASIR